MLLRLFAPGLVVSLRAHPDIHCVVDSVLGFAVGSTAVPRTMGRMQKLWSLSQGKLRECMGLSSDFPVHRCRFLSCTPHNGFVRSDQADVRTEESRKSGGTDSFQINVAKITPS